MTKEAFEQEILHQLNTQLDRYPAMQRQDTVKFVFQARPGAGHLLASRDAAEEYPAREMDPLPAGRFFRKGALSWPSACDTIIPDRFTLQDHTGRQRGYG